MKTKSKSFKEFCNLTEKHLFKVPVTDLMPILLFIAHRDNLHFYESGDKKRFITTARHFKLLRTKLLNEVLYN